MFLSKYLLSLILTGIILCFVSCTKDKALPPPVIKPACDTLQPSYATCIQPLFVNQCYECHSDSASVNGTIGFDIQDFMAFKTYLTYFYRNDSIYGSKFMAEITGKINVPRMPPSGGNIPQQDCRLIQTWINNGAPFN